MNRISRARHDSRISSRSSRFWDAGCPTSLLMCLLALIAAPLAAQSSRSVQFGGNVNERSHWLEPALLDQTKTTWVRGFFPASEFMSGQRSYETDKGLLALKQAADSGHKVILSIKWDCAQQGKAGPVPAPGSAQEQAWFGFADKLTAATAGKLSILVVVNELFIDTQKPDLEPGPGGQVPMVQFLKRLVDHLSAEHLVGSDGRPLPIFAGGFTRLERPGMQSNVATREMLQWINSDPHVAGADFHVHEPDMKASKQSIEFMRRNVPTKPLIVTEFSLVFAWKEHLADEIGSGAAGKDFAKQYGISPKLSVADFCNQAFENPVLEQEWHDFLKSQPWFDGHYLDEIGPIMSANGVAVATYALTLNPLKDAGSRPFHVTPDMTPWFLNDLLIPGLAVSPEPTRAPENYELFDSYVRWQEQHGKH